MNRYNRYQRVASDAKRLLIGVGARVGLYPRCPVSGSRCASMCLTPRVSWSLDTNYYMPEGCDGCKSMRAARGRYHCLDVGGAWSTAGCHARGTLPRQCLTGSGACPWLRVDVAPTLGRAERIASLYSASCAARRSGFVCSRAMPRHCGHCWWLRYDIAPTLGQHVHSSLLLGWATIYALWLCVRTDRTSAGCESAGGSECVNCGGHCG